MSSSECRFGLDVLLRSAFAFWAWDPRYSERSKRVLLLFGFFFHAFQSDTATVHATVHEQ